MGSGQLQYYLHDDFDAFRIELAGSLSGGSVEGVYQAWRTALSVLTGRKVIVDITFVNTADERGRSLLRLWRRKGARIVARSPESRALAADTVGEPVLDTPASPKMSWLARVMKSLFRPVAAIATIPAQANKPACGDDEGERETNQLNALSRSRLMEPRVH